jgi:lambda family phage tail tape measure protein
MSDEQRLLISFEARLTKYERDLERAKGKTRTNFRTMEKQAEDTAKRMDSVMGGALKSFGKGLIGGIVGGLAIGGLDQIISRVGDIAKGVASIGDKAKMAGLSSKAFQELGYVAEQNRIEVDALVDGMKELNLRADEFIVTGKGSAADAFQRLGYSAQDLKRKLADPSALLVEIIGRLQHLDKAAQIRISDKIFGGSGGEKFVQLIDRGADSIRATIKEANDLGIVLDDDVIKRADEIDRKFNQIAKTVSTRLKYEVVETVTALAGFMDRLNEIEEQGNHNVQNRLVETYQRIENAKDKIGELQSMKATGIGDWTTDGNIQLQTKQLEDLTVEAMRLRDILDRRSGYSENFIYKAGDDANGAKPPLDNLNNSLFGTGSTASNAVKGINSYADAIRALKDEIPELANSLRDLDTKARIDEVYRIAVTKARTMGEIYAANEARGGALKANNVKSATDDPTGYLSNNLASGKAQSHVEGMAKAFADKLATMLASMPDDLKGDITINSGFRSIERQQELWLDALKKYGSPEAAWKWVAPPGNSQHNKGNAADLGYSSDQSRQWAHENAGKFGLSFPLANENWHVEDSDARSAANSAEVERKTTALMQQIDAYKGITASAREHIAGQETERQALGMSAQAAAQLRYEQQMLADVQSRGITLTAEQRREISQLAAGMASADANVQQFAQTQEQAAQVAQFFGSQAVDALSGLITGTMTAEQALQNLIATLIKAALQAALLGEGPLAGILGGGSGGGGGVGLGGIIGAIFGFASGGYTGDGGKHQPAGVVHRGEFVMSKAATRRLGVANLDAMHQSALKGYASGGLVGSAPSLAQPALRSGNDNNPAQTFQISAPITVEGSAGTPEQNSDLANKMAKQMEVTMRTVVADEFRRQARPGNFLNSRNR